MYWLINIYKLKWDNIEITLFSLLICILTFVTITTIINYNDFNNQFYTVYIQAEPNNNNENEEKDDKKEENKKELWITIITDMMYIFICRIDK